MSNKIQKILKQEYDKLKKVLNQLVTPGNARPMPQPALRPCPTRKFHHK